MEIVFLSSSLSWLWTLKLVWNRSSKSSNVSDFPSKVGIVVVRDLGSFETLLLLLLTLAELLFVANCWRANKIWSASIVAGVFSLRNCGWLVERAFFFFSWGNSRGAVGNLFLNCCHHVIAIANLFWTSCHHVGAISNLSLKSCHHVTTIVSLFYKSCHHVTTVFGPEFCVVWPRKMPASGWGSLWESSSFVPWFSTFVFRNVPGLVPECVLICGFKKNSSNVDGAPKMRHSVLLNSWDNFSLTLPSISSKSCVIDSSLILGTDVFPDWPFLGCSCCISLVTAANFRAFLSVAIFWSENATQFWRLNYFLFVNQVETVTKNIVP